MGQKVFVNDSKILKLLSSSLSVSFVVVFFYSLPIKGCLFFYHVFMSILYSTVQLSSTEALGPKLEQHTQIT